MDFANIYDQGYARVAARVLPVKLADPAANAAAIIEDAKALAADGVCLAVYPELCLTGVSCGDLFWQDALLDAAEAAVDRLAQATQFEDLPALVVGAPLRQLGRLYDGALVIADGRIVTMTAKPHPTLSQERWFSEGAGFNDVPPVFMVKGLGDAPGAVMFDDDADTTGATVLVSLAGAPASVDAAWRRQLYAKATSLRRDCVYVAACAGPGESSTDAAWDGQAFIYDGGELLGEAPRFVSGSSGVIADVDLRHPARHDDRLPSGDIGLRRPVARFPFVPNDAAALAQWCDEVRAIQVAALAQRLQSIGAATKAVIGVSGGLDSTNALLVAAGAMDQLGRDRADIIAYTMPGFATSEGTKSHAWQLMEAVGVTAGEIDIRPAATQMMTDLGHPVDLFDVTFENIQAGLRADYLFRAANQHGGIVIGTGDLSEAALGWCTYGVGDHISHYNVNAGLPKTLMQYLIRHIAARGLFPAASGLLNQIVAQEISPELVPASQGAPIQSTESTVGPYALNDFFLFHTLKGARPSRILFLAEKAWADLTSGTWPDGTPDDQKVAYDRATIKTWLARFYQRFFTSQFKRSASPDGPQVLPVSLSPRGGWVMPSDATAKAWLDELA